MIKVLVVDDEYHVGMGIQQTIAWKDYDIEIVDIAYDGEEGLEMAIEYKPDIIITDIRMPIMDGLQMIEHIREQAIQTKFIVLSGYDEFEYAKTALNRGVSSYLLKPVENKELIIQVTQLAEQIKQEKEQHKRAQYMNEERPYYQEIFLKEVLNNKIRDIKKVDESINALNIKFDFTKYRVVAVRFKGEGLNIFSIEEIEQAFKVMGNKCEYVGPDFIVLEKGMNEWGILIEDQGKEERNILKVIQNQLMDMLRAKKEICIQNLWVSISSVQNKCYQMYEAYQEAIKLCDVSRTVGENRREIHLALDYMREHIHESITIEDIASALYMSASHLMHLFKQELGKTMIECLVDMRIEVAKQLLVNPKYKVYEVANQVGYTDVKYFGKIFKLHVGITPKSYAKRSYLLEDED